MLYLHRAESTAQLAEELARVLSRPLADPFMPEVIAVPAKGVERWLCQRLSSVLGAHTPAATDGIAANIAFPSPARLVSDTIQAVEPTTDGTDPWDAESVVWKLLDVLDASLDEPWCRVLARHFGYRPGAPPDFRVGRRYATAAHLTQLFRHYSAERPGLLADWLAGRNSDGAGGRLDPDLTWQPHLWRALRSQVGHPSLAERLDSMCEVLRGDPGTVPLPERVSLFGPTRLTTEQLQVISAVAAHREVHIWVPHPSPAMWSRLENCSVPGRRSSDTTVRQVSNPLLASLSRDIREFQLRVAPLCDEVHHHETHTESRSLLDHLKSTIRHDQPPQPGVRRDASIQVHSCHGISRQVEALRESLLHLFSEIPDLEPRDVLVMCPDIETVAPHIRAAFGQDIATHPGQQLRVRLADRNLRQTNPLLSVVSSLLMLAGGRVTASELLDFAAAGPVRRAFRFSDDDVERLREWTATSGARWGLGELQRARFRLRGFPQNTFETGLDRILLGVAADESDSTWIDKALPLDDIGSGDIDLAGRFAEFIERLESVLGGLQGARPAREWSQQLVDALDLLTDVAPADAWQAGEAHAALGDATRFSGDVTVRLSDVRALLDRVLAGRPTRANFRTGELTVCTMVPMRSVPHRVIVLLGLDDDRFPRGTTTNGDDVLNRDPCIGERDPRSEDRQLLLDAIMAAQDRLLLFYTGCDPVTGTRRPPAVPLGELIDALTAMTGGSPIVTHPLQPFDARNFDPADPRSFDVHALAGAQANQQPPVPLPPFLAAPLPVRPSDIDLAELVAFFTHPVQGFLRQRLGVVLPADDEEIEDTFSAQIDGLTKWDIGDRMLQAVLSGRTIGDFRAAEMRRGTLPPFTLGMQILDDISETVDILATTSRALHQGPSATFDIAADLGDGRRVVGTVSGIHGETIARTLYSRLSPKHRLQAWLQLVALASSVPGQWRAVTTGRGQRHRPAWRSVLVAPENPIEILRHAADLRDRGLAEPLPFAATASADYATRRHSGSTVKDAMEGASSTFNDKYGDCTDEHYAFVFGNDAPFEQMTALLPRVDETTWYPEPTRFGVLACRAWTPLLDHESLGEP
ncbi:exodeoxyribonuclease V subunit gamma [Hoyosella sp. YIM 151337]|uniref:exodeoxyribonuclease V subunit gamma n=1 Tax=Hoyosella sp. YIM 151337 TaxID=2992742 RepID=UPI0022365CD5|nr:exodeoxyribonuclease V subunit gamma [Hoyosella sp. YIM 151337]MCW4354375.1 exodeoxyribonuclease V subunit gamma [Hoyosella sp. YIM 151337]